MASRWQSHIVNGDIDPQFTFILSCVSYNSYSLTYLHFPPQFGTIWPYTVLLCHKNPPKQTNNTNNMEIMTSNSNKLFNTCLTACFPPWYVSSSFSSAFFGGIIWCCFCCCSKISLSTGLCLSFKLFKISSAISTS